jgi:hypothetical protein
MLLEDGSGITGYSVIFTAGEMKSSRRGIIRGDVTGERFHSPEASQ